MLRLCCMRCRLTLIDLLIDLGLADQIDPDSLRHREHLRLDFTSSMAASAAGSPAAPPSADDALEPQCFVKLRLPRPGKEEQWPVRCA